MSEVIDFNEERISFYYQLGVAITQWAHIENSISWIVTNCLGTKASKASGPAFFAIENFRSKLMYADTIVTTYISDKKHLTEWAVLLNRAQTLARARNKLAHSTVMNYPSAKPGRRVALHLLRPKSSGMLCVRDIKRRQLEFSALSIALENFQSILSGQKEKFPKYLEQPQNPPTLAKLRRDIYAYVQRPPQPLRE